MIEPKTYAPDYRLSDAYDEAMLFDEKGFEGLCPFYVELTRTVERFQDSCLLGKGAVKEVYKTFNNHTKRWVARACLRKDRGPEFYDLFLNEAWLTASLNHPNIITVHDAGVGEDGRPFFTMDLKGNFCLSDRVAESTPGDRRELLEIFIKVCDAMAYAHDRGVVHLDLKPENIQCDRFGEVLVCDWGLAKLVHEMNEAQNEMPLGLRSYGNMTLMGQIKGSLGYMAPEQVVPGFVKNQQTDIFALGCLLHLILTGHPPFTGTEEDVLEATRTGHVVPPSVRYPECQIPEALEAVVLKAIAKVPEDRYASVEILRNEISSFLGGYSTLAENSGFFREARLFIQRNRLAVTIVFVSVVVLTIVMMLTVQSIRKLREKTALQQQRVALFETKAKTATALYNEELARSEKVRFDLARELSTSASNLKKLGIFIRPIETVEEAHKLVASAFSLNADCAEARLQYFSLSCIALDFKTALRNPVTADSEIADYQLFVDAFPEFDFTETRRPSIPQLTNFLQQVLEINPNRIALMERIVAYDFACRDGIDSYVEPVQALLEYVNQQKGDFRLSLDAEHAVLTVDAARRVRFIVPGPWGSSDSLLRFLPFRTLKLNLAERFNLVDLKALPVESIDFRQCREVYIQGISLPLLRTVYIRPGQLDPAELRRAIQSNEQFEIIEENEE
ncbi:serine/threonine-protein kinase [Pontiellaceae bacterium B12219]|nr:serine/threonine-protein kinase [Pontiellaceae bacterium B12219]